MLKRRFMQSLVAVTLFVAMICQGTGVLAGTTGGLSGTVLDEKGAAVVGATVSVASPTGIAKGTTDSNGKFSFLALAPDTYVVSVEKTGYEATSVAGVTVFADGDASVQIVQRHELRTIGTVTSRAASALIKPGTVGDVYNITAAQQDKIQGVGGGGNLNTAWSAIATVPGVFVSPGQAGYIGAGPSVSIRGGDYDQIGYEIDGVPVNRAFDNYPSGPASSLGQQELQVYTGVPPANAQANGLSGFINQVIRTGTYPGFAQADLGIGGEAYYHKAAFEVGGATPSRNFSYYLGIGGYNQDFNYFDNTNGAGISQNFGTPLAPCNLVANITPKLAPSCYTNGVQNFNNLSGGFVMGPYNLFAQSNLIDRDNVLNLHFGIPHKNGLKDDIQVLGIINYLDTLYYSSTNDQGGSTYLNNIGLGTPFYYDGLVFNGPTGIPLPANVQSKISNYSFPSTPNHSFFGSIDPSERDSTLNDQAIYKIQYTHNFSSNALFKVYGYTYYSDWLQTGPQSTYADYSGCCSPDYELSAHTRGVSGSFINQINSQNLLNLTGSWTGATTVRDNNTTMINGIYPFIGAPGLVTARTGLAVLVNGNSPTSGVCYTLSGTPTTCQETPNTAAAYATLAQAQTNTIPVPTATNCGGGPCEYYVIGNGQYATYNQVKPTFINGSLTDEFKPTSKLTINAGLRFDEFQYQGANTSGTGARTLFYNAFNMDTCQDASHNLYDKVDDLGSTISASCSSLTAPNGAKLFAVNVTNPSGNVTSSFSEWQPRFGFTYSLDPVTVFRADYGRYAQGPNSAFVQYNTQQPNAPYALYNTYSFQKFGFTTPDHPVQPEVSNNFDFSIEHQFKGDVSIKLSPFYRKTQDQIQQFYLNQQSGFVSGLNVGRQTSEGVEFELDKGDFSRQGVSARLTFAYTNSFINYTALADGSSVITPLNTGISDYNAYTAACGPGGKDLNKTQFGQKICGNTNGGSLAAPCYTTSGTPDPTCAAGDIANPYWNAPVQGFLNPNANYPTFDILPGGMESSADAFGAPYTATLVLNDRIGRFSVAPIFQMFAGQRYGAPATTIGVAPDQCGGILASAVSGDPRYPYGAPGGSPYDALSCGVLTAGEPDVYTRGFDSIGAFVAPATLQAHLQLSYDASKNVTIVGNLTNLLYRCFGGTSVKWAVSNACGYGTLYNAGYVSGTAGGIGNGYNPGAPIQTYFNRPYAPQFQGFPFSFFLNAKIKV